MMNTRRVYISTRERQCLALFQSVWSVGHLAGAGVVVPSNLQVRQAEVLLVAAEVRVLLEQGSTLSASSKSFRSCRSFLSSPLWTP